MYSDPLDDDPTKCRDWCFNSVWTRPKTSTTSLNVILPHRSKWLLCTVHAIACHAATLISPSDYVHAEFRSGKNSITFTNNTFKRIQAVYDSSVDETKPKQYTRGLTSHSNRVGAEQLMHENSTLRREWSDRRVGRVFRSDSRNSYISHSSWLDDYACALVLSGWPSIHWGGRSPNKACIPETDHQCFDEYIGNIFQRVPMVPASILEIWGCSLLLWHFDVKAMKEDSEVVMKIESMLSVDKLQLWHDCVRDCFRDLNRSTLPLEVVHQLSVAENLTWQNNSIAKLQENISFLTSSNVTQEKFNTAVVQRLDQQTNMLQQLLDIAERQEQQQPTPKRRRGHQQVEQPLLVQAQLPFQQPAEQPPGPDLEVEDNDVQEHVDTSVKRRLSDRLQNIETLFYTWYIEELWNMDCMEKNERSYLKNTVSTLVIYMKRFVPPDCTILLQKPKNEEVERHRVWVNDLRRLSLTVKEETMKFIQSYHKNIKEKELSRCVLNKAKTYATRKYLLEIPVQMFPPLLVVDNITQSTPYVFSSNIDLKHIQSVRKT